MPHMTISGKTQLLGLLGWPVSHSFSPTMHNAASKSLGLNYVYVPLPTRPETLPSAIQGLPALGFRGVNVTVPHKQAVIPHLTHLDPAVQAIGAVNTILVDSGQWIVDSGGKPTRLPTSHQPLAASRQPLAIGYNTDHAGFMVDLAEQSVDVAGKTCIVLGAGGSARAVAYGLGMASGRVHIYSRRPQQAQQLCTDFAHLGSFYPHPWSDLPTVHTLNPALIVNTTPLGMMPNVDLSPWPDELVFPAGTFAYDLVYNPTHTKFMHQAQSAGSGASNGLGMLIHQAILAYEIWTGSRPSSEVMKQAIAPTISSIS